MVLSDYDDYKNFLADWVTRQAKTRGVQGRLAEAADCQPSYLSRILRGHLHLTPEQAFKVARHLGLNDVERDYFLELVHKGRAGTEELRRFHAARAQRLQDQLKDVIKPKDAASPSSNLESIYYEHWFHTALHVLVSIERYANIDAAAAKLGLPRGIVEQALAKLESAGIVKKDGKRWRAQSVHIHSTVNSPFSLLHLYHWRQRAMQSAQLSSATTLHYSGVHSLSLRDAAEIRGRLRDLTAFINEIVPDSPEEEAVCINLDFFPL